MTPDVTAAELQTRLREDGTVLIQFWAEWCAPCRAMIPVVDAFAAEQEGQISVVRVDLDQEPGVAADYRVIAVPAFAVATSAGVVDSWTGAMPPRAFAARVAQAFGRAA
ncbi:thioredoxin family protein [Leucobacter sp. M11]|uniref:thioredoxin family protein n=1 Tax=Leucobacter sp. M11 TaxID=2993565 RepID=UPI002D7F6A9C|nr:thioredoxin family protein [Leucobacter sp. M11]MEB4616405.1 thioredoxin family protein [Leucobacter sp. M11]